MDPFPVGFGPSQMRYSRKRNYYDWDPTFLKMNKKREVLAIPNPKSQICSKRFCEFKKFLSGYVAKLGYVYLLLVYGN